MLRKIIIGGCAGSVAIFAMLPNEEPPRIQLRPQLSQFEKDRSDKKTASAHAQSWGASPFSTVNPDMSAAERLEYERKTRMHDYGYATPDAYYKMSAAELEKLAAKDDVAAHLQLADRAWWSGASAHGREGSLQKQQMIAIDHFIKAAKAGTTATTGAVAALALESNDVIEAAAWNMVAGHFQQPVDTKAASVRFGKLNYAQLSQAYERAQDLAAMLGRPMNTPNDVQTPGQ